MCKESLPLAGKCRTQNRNMARSLHRARRLGTSDCGEIWFADIQLLEARMRRELERKSALEKCRDKEIERLKKEKERLKQETERLNRLNKEIEKLKKENEMWKKSREYHSKDLEKLKEEEEMLLKRRGYKSIINKEKEEPLTKEKRDQMMEDFKIFSSNIGKSMEKFKKPQ